MEQTLLIAGAVAVVSFALGFITCGLFTGGKAAELVDELDELEDKLHTANVAQINAEIDRDDYKARLQRLTDRDARGRFVRGEV